MDEAGQILLLEELLKSFSPTGQESTAAALLVSRMEALGFSAYLDDVGNVIGSIGDGPQEIILLGHIDTVPGEIPVRQEGDWLWGRGSVDAKGPLACFTAAAAQVGLLPNWRVTLIGAVGEEGDSRGAQYVRTQYQPQFCVIGEPSSWDHLTLGYKGSTWQEYSCTRPLAHTAAKAESASEVAVRFWNAVQAKAEVFNQGKTRTFDQISTSLRSMHSGEDGFSEWANLRMNFRLPPEVSVSQLQEWLAPLTGDGTLHLLDGVDCYRADKNTPLVRAFLAAIRKEQGKPGFLVKTGTSDMNTVGPAWNCPILAYGPGDSNLDHTPEERISISEYLAAIRVLSNALLTLTAASPAD